MGSTWRVSHSADEPVPAEEPMPFEWTCPKCGHQRVQGGYTRGMLSWSLEGGHKIDAYCPGCDALWAIGPQERVEIARALASEKSDVIAGEGQPPICGG